MTADPDALIFEGFFITFGAMVVVMLSSSFFFVRNAKPKSDIAADSKRE